jgi:hypothetical protein
LREEGAHISKNWLINWKTSINLCISYKWKLVNQMLVYRGITVHAEMSAFQCVCKKLKSTELWANYVLCTWSNLTFKHSTVTHFCSIFVWIMKQSLLSGQTAETRTICNITINTCFNTLLMSLH